MYDGNPGEIDIGSSLREVRVSEGSSYRESTLTNTYRNHFLRPYENRSILKVFFCSHLCFFFKALTISLSGLPKTKNAEVILKLKQMTLNRDLVAEVINMWVPFFMVLFQVTCLYRTKYQTFVAFFLTSCNVYVAICQLHIFKPTVPRTRIAV